MSELSIEQAVKEFISKHQISCAEAVHQDDSVILSAYEFIEQLCELSGYWQDPEDE